MALFRKNRPSTPPGEGDYGRVFGADGEVIGFWFESAHHANDSALIGALQLKHDLSHLVGTGHRVVSNTVDDAGGLFVMFGGARAPGEPAAVQLPPEQAPAAQGATESLTVNGRSYPLHSDFDAFSRDAAAGKTALLRTTIAGLSRDDQRRLFRVISAAYGDDAPETRAVSSADFSCLACFHGYSPAVLLLRDHLKSGGRSNVQDMTECRICGDQDAVWIYRAP